MPTNGELHEGKRTPARRKSKPKFEVPPEIGAVPATPWVYRADSMGEPEPDPAIPYVSPVAYAQRTPDRPQLDGVPDPTTIMLAALETMAISVAAASRMFLAAASLMGAPIGVTRKILGM